ncbi:MAG: NfeD family protein [Acidobacteria bacterium]|nr:NfeD family protein [Acidobacteriota bacterium]
MDFDLFSMSWLAWLVLGIVLAGLELLTPGGFFLIFFGVGALLVGVLDLFGVAGPAWMQWLMFTALSLASLRVFRKPLLEWMRRGEASRPQVDTLEGELATPLADIAVGEVGRAEMRGSAWAARNVSAEVLARGQRCRVRGVNGLTIDIVPEGVR